MTGQSKLRSLFLAVAVAALSMQMTGRAHAEAQLLIEEATGKVLHAENATYPWYPASVTKLMTVYTTLRAIREKRVTFNSMITMSSNATAQPPTKMGLRLGTSLTIDNAIKMLMVKSANDLAVAIAEGVGGSIEGFADMMNANARRLGMSQSNFVNPNGLPAEGHVTSARDLGILALALYHEFPESAGYWSIHSIRYGNRVLRNYNTLMDRYPGADGMKTGFICASGYNLVASATRNGRRLIAIVLGAYSGAVRAQKAAQMLERGFNGNNLTWLTPSLGTVDALAPIDAPPPNLRDEMCGGHRRKPPSEDNQEEEVESNANPEAGAAGQAFMLSNLKPASGKFVLGPPIDTTPPIVVFTGSPDKPDVVAVPHGPKKKPKAKVAGKPSDAKPAAEVKSTADVKAAAAKTAAKPATAKPAAAKPAAADKPAAAKPAAAKPAAAAAPAKPKVSSATVQ